MLRVSEADMALTWYLLIQTVRSSTENPACLHQGGSCHITLPHLHTSIGSWGSRSNELTLCPRAGFGSSWSELTFQNHGEFVDGDLWTWNSKLCGSAFLMICSGSFPYGRILGSIRSRTIFSTGQQPTLCCPLHHGPCCSSSCGAAWSPEVALGQSGTQIRTHS